MKLIAVSSGDAVMVDDDDYEWLSSIKWKADSDGYALRREKTCDGIRFISMHRILMGLTYGDKSYVDHIDGNIRNNQKANLRICNQYQNQWNRGICSNNTSGYKGVSKWKGRDTWRATIRLNGKVVHLGTFKTAEEAHDAYRKAALACHGEYFFRET